MYIGQTRDTLNCRFNRHRSDILCYGDCSFEADLSVPSWKKLNDMNIYENTKKINGLYTMDKFGYYLS